MDPDLQKYLDNLASIRNDLNTMIPEARGILKDIKQTEKRVRDLISDGIKEQVITKIQDTVTEELRELSEQTKTHIEAVEDGISKRITNLVDMLLGTKDLPPYNIENLISAKAIVDAILEETRKREGYISASDLPSAFKKKKAQVNDPRRKNWPV